MSDLEPASPGQVLANQREESEISLREVADALNLPISTLEDIEADALDRLPAEVYTRGYVRAYARYLRLDPDPIVAALAYSGSSEAAAVLKPQQTLFDLNNPNLRMVLIGCAALLVVAFLWYFLSSSEDSSSAAEPMGTDAEVSEVKPNLADERAIQLETVTPEPLADTAQETSQGSVLETGQMIEMSAAAIELPSVQSAPVVADESTRRLTATGSEQLQLTFTDECWVEIKTTDGTTLYDDLGGVGVVWKFLGEGPFQLLLGYAPGVTLRFNDEQVSLVPHTRNNVARLVLGQ
ncbi:MAG: cytoskeleton protein RodZ [Limisphaerales bacterium]|jgi:cytoskeleton protein RodZ